MPNGKISESERTPWDLEQPEAYTPVGGQSVAARRQNARRRVMLVVALLVAMLVVAKTSGAGEQLDRKRVRQMLLDAGVWSIPLFIVIFSVGELMHVPGVVFIAVSVWWFGWWFGGALAYFAGLCSCATGFLVTRLLGGGATLEQLDLPLPACLRNAFARLRERPVQTVALLRCVFFLAPSLNSALALTPIRLRDYMFGSGLGLLVPFTPTLVIMGMTIDGAPGS